ncbi:SHOCT domain-containing protein [Mucilaginibacter psychrotolerans]|uniref:SHOCT domain-containing protein n=1 Tax=Mucilaginibacter psychrotolerans TaxID=1524096 RepID=A0A4Y8S3L3_9SPHI|nr:SHOCT domain-containing protein [Mucilaginibacter psychrotolerans]
MTTAVYINNIPPAPQSKSKADELAKLAKLQSDGVLTQEEFEAEKRRLLS